MRQRLPIVWIIATFILWLIPMAQVAASPTHELLNAHLIFVAWGTLTLAAGFAFSRRFKTACWSALVGICLLVAVDAFTVSTTAGLGVFVGPLVFLACAAYGVLTMFGGGEKV